MTRGRRMAGGATLGVAAMLLATAPAVPATAPGLVRIVAPEHGAALDHGGPVSIVLRHAGGVRITGIAIAGRPATPRVRRLGPGLLRLTFPTGRELRAGRNTITVHSRRGGAVDSDAVGVVMALSRDGLVAVASPRPGQRIPRGPVRTVVRVPDHATQVQIRLNGRLVPEAQWDQRWRAGRLRLRLNASDGLRHGANLLTVTALRGAERQVVRRRVVISGSAPLAAPGRDRVVRPGAAVALDGRRSVHAPPGVTAHQAGDDLEYAWNVTASPEGSTARLVGADTATPMLTPDVAGDYTVSLVVAHGGVASARETTTVTARAPGLIPVAADSRTLTITVADDARPPDPTTRNAVLHYVGYDRTSGEVMFEDTLGASSTAPDRYRAMLRAAGSDRVVVTAVTPNAAATADGRALITAVGGRSAVTIPNVARWTSQTNRLTGFLAAGTGGDLTFAFGDYRPFRLISDGAGSTTNTVTVGDASYTATLPKGALGGFQVLRLDPTDLSLVSNTAVVTRDARDTVEERDLIAALSAPGLTSDLVFIVSLGRSRGYVIPEGRIQSLGGTPDAINPLKGDDRYGLVYTPPYLDGDSPASQAIEVSSVIDRHPSQYLGLGGTVPPVQVSGHLSRRSDGLMQPAAAVRGADTAPADPELENFTSVVYRAATSWPSTDTPGGRAALAWIGAQLRLGEDPRAAYVDAGFVPADRRLDLSELGYVPGLGFTESEFAFAKEQLLEEFEAVDQVRTTLRAVGDTFGAPDALKRYSDIQATSRAVQDAVAPKPARAHFNMLRVFGGAALALGKVTSGPTSQALGFAGEVMTVAADLSHTTPSRDPGDLVVDDTADLQSEVSNRIVDYMDTLGGIEAAILSDHGRLMAAKAQIDKRNWAWSEETAAATSEQFTRGIAREAWVSTVGTVYTTYRLDPTGASHRYPNGGLGCKTGYRMWAPIYDTAKPGTIQTWWDGSPDGASRVIARTGHRAGMYPGAYRLAALPDSLRLPLFTAIVGRSTGVLEPAGFYPPHFANQLSQKTMRCTGPRYPGVGYFVVITEG